MWIETLSRLYDDDPEKITSKQIWCKTCICLLDVCGFNEGTDSYTTIELRNGDRISIAVKYDVFKNEFTKNLNMKTFIEGKASYEFSEQSDLIGKS